MIPKLRGWDKKQKKMCEIKAWSSFNGGEITVKRKNENASYVIPMTHILIMRSTGIKDQNGTEIFEGDIVLTYDGDFGKIAYNKELALWEVQFNDEVLNLSDVVAFDVVGNIYEHKHLLEEE